MDLVIIGWEFSVGGGPVGLIKGLELEGRAEEGFVSGGEEWEVETECDSGRTVDGVNVGIGSSKSTVGMIVGELSAVDGSVEGEAPGEDSWWPWEGCEGYAEDEDVCKR